jgi:endo-1,4-beta-xylanase
MTDPPAPPIHRRRGRIRLLLGAPLAIALALGMAAIVPGVAKAAAICSNQTGTNGGMYYQMYVSGGSACITLNSSSSYSTTWSGIGDFVAGVGWNPGSTSNSVSFNSSLSASGGTALVSLYGWSTNPLVEYYVEENYSGSPNAAGTYMGQVTSDGGTFNIYEHQQVNQPSIQGTATFEQYLAIRTSPTSSGTITFGNFVNAWASHGMNLGTMNYQIMATESYGGGSGSSSISLGSSSGGGGSGGGGSGGGGGGSSGCTATLSAGSSGSNWYNLNVSVSGSNSWTVTVDMVAPAVVYSTYNVNATWPSEYVMVATPNGSGNNWGFTVSPNGQWTWPSISCSTG